MTVLLRSSEVEDLVDLTTAMKVLEETYVDQAGGQVKAIPPLRLMDRGHSPGGGGDSAGPTGWGSVSVPPAATPWRSPTR